MFWQNLQYAVGSETIWSQRASKQSFCDRKSERFRGFKFMTKGELTRKKIVEAAAPIFNQHGYEGSSLNALMGATGLKKVGIYRHFSSKEELAAEAFD